jgi:hypothetical protein
MLLENAIMDSEQVATFITQHRQTLVEFCFEDVSLRNGDWESTLEPLRKMNRSKRNAAQTRGRVSTHVMKAAVDESMDVPCMLSPIDIPSEPIIMETLEPQEEPRNHWTGVGKSLGMGRWFEKRSRAKKGGYGKEVGGGDHWRKVLHGNIFAWR